MRFVKVNGFKLMKVGKTHNTLELDEDIIKESLIHHVFDNAPIVFNENKNFRDYRDNNVVEKFIKENVIGVILPGTVNFDGLYVTADVMLQEEFENRTQFDNWSIIMYKKDDCYFYYNSCELFSKGEKI